MILPDYDHALITGASSGIGEAIAGKLAAPGRRLYLVSRTASELDRVAGKLRAKGAEAIPIVIDITAAGASQSILETVQAYGHPIRLLINNAGFGYYGNFRAASPDDMMKMIELNVKSVVSLSHLFVREMTKENRGAIMNVSSTASFQPVPFMAVYAATKAFVTSFSMALASELADSNIKVIALCPGRTKTNFQLVAGSNKVRVRSRSASVDDVAEVAVRALERGTPLAIEGFTNKFVTHAQRLFPRRAVLALARRIFRPIETKEVV